MGVVRSEMGYIIYSLITQWVEKIIRTSAIIIIPYFKWEYATGGTYFDLLWQPNYLNTCTCLHLLPLIVVYDIVVLTI